jgi:hypothetical protein
MYEMPLMDSAFPLLSRRAFVFASVAAAAFPSVACSRESTDAAAPGQANWAPTAASLAMTVHKDPTCPCCDGWAAIAREAGFAVTVVKEPEMGALKQRLGVPGTLWSCHTAEVAGLVFEGHVPLEHVSAVLRKRPQGLVGLAVAGMPRGTPGMEMPDGAKDPYEVIAFDKTGQTRVFARG